MKIPEITPSLKAIFPSATIEENNQESWQIQTETTRLLVILSVDKSWLRVLTPIASITEAQSLLMPLMEANFDTTGAIRYGIGQNVLWGIFQHNFNTLTVEDFQEVMLQMVSLAQKGLSEAFQQLVAQKIKQIIQAAKAQGQTKEATYQTLERFYQEGMLGNLDRDPQEQKNFLAAWKLQLDKLWDS